MNKHLTPSAGIPHRLRCLRAVVPAFALVWVAGAAAQSAGVGKVVFVSGPAQLQAANGELRVVSAGAEIRQGDQVVTGKDAYVHLRMVDQAFVAVRPESKLAVELYEYDAAAPGASRIKLNLTSGNTRTVSGKGGEAAKQNYRFNTPMAAIGLRGTDYTVASSAEATRVSVARGGVSVTPLGDDCSAGALGPCATSASRDLAAGMSHAYLEVKSGARLPVLVRPENDPQGGSGQNPSNRPEEPRSESKGDAKIADTKDAATQVAADRIASGLLPGAEASPPQFVWGRWSSYAQGPGAPAVATLVEGRDVMVGNEVFSLLRQSSPVVDLPAQGSFDFKMAGSEAYVVNAAGATAAQVSGGNFNIDFLRRGFSTALTVKHAGGVESLQAAGSVQWQGFLVSDPARSNMNVAGAVATGGKEAAYLFDKSLTSGGLLGAVRWVR